jgi:DNA-binding transcriptional LysR family regulator
MEFYQLEALIAVVEEHGFTRAAERVFRTQAAVSVAIRKLEEEIGVPLLVRGSHECTLTEAGHATLTYARRLTGLRNQMERHLAEFTSLGVGRVSIAANESAAQYLLPSALAAFHSQHPAIKIIARLCDVDDIAHLVAKREVDLGFGIRQANLGGLGLRSEVVHTDPLALVVAPGHRFSRCATVQIADLRDEKFFVHHLHTATIDRIEQLFEGEGVRLNIAGELWSFETIKAFVRAGFGVAIIPLSVANPDLATGRLARVPVLNLDIARAIEVVYRAEDQLLPAPADLLRILRQWRWDQDTRIVGDAPRISTRVGSPAK